MAVRGDDLPASVVGQRMTLDAFLALPEVKPALEYVDGVVTQKVSPQGRHVLLQLRFANRINTFAEPGQLALALPELRTTYSGLSRVPDIAVYLWHRIPLREDGQIGDRFVEPPDIAIEIVSPDQRLAALMTKCVWFVKNGVRIALIADPDEEVVYRFRPDALPDVLRDDDRIDLDAVLPGFEITVNQLFALLILNA
ncbi:MAG: Uma2 family endonuclease [Chloroflexota bacterium]